MKNSKLYGTYLLPGSFAEGIWKDKRNLMFRFCKVIIFSLPFEGGVAGIIDYLIFTRFISRPGWLI
jgi:hypothetical protein